jgi:flagellar assembly protein FliH
LSDAATSYDFEQLEASDPPPRDGPARLLAKATAEAEQIREDARREGFEAGRAAGHERGSAEVAAAAGALAAAVAGIEALRGEIVEAVEADVVDVVQGALRRINDRRKITVMVNPADLDVVKAAIGELTAQGSGVELCELQSDERVGVGAAIVRTSEGEVDASVHTQLERAREVVSLSLQTVDGAA